MLSKKSLFVAFTTAAFLFSCKPIQIGTNDDGRGDNMIGERLSKLSSLSKPDGQNRNVIAIHDSTVQKIQIFDLQNNRHLRSLDAMKSTTDDTEHFVLYDDQGNYVIDITTQGFAIINKNNEIRLNPVTLMGKPISAAFRPDLGYLILYDDAGTVGLLKLNTYGDIQQAWLGGSRIDGATNATISAGDLLDNGKLLVSLTDGRLAVIDVEQSLQQRRWIYTAQTTGLAKAQWVSRLPGENDKVLFRTSESSGDTTYLYDVNTNTALANYTINGKIERSSRNASPHFLITSTDGKELSIVYPDTTTNTFKVIQQFRYNLTTAKTIAASRLDLAKNTLSFVEIATQRAYYDDNMNYNSFKQNRTYRRFRLPDMLLQNSFAIPNETLMEMSEDYILSLFPHKLGYAVSQKTDGTSKSEFKFFNRGSLKKE